MEEIQNLSKQIDFDLTYRYKGNNDPRTFIGFKGRLYNTRKSRRRTKKIKSEVNETVIGCKKSED